MGPRRGTRPPAWPSGRPAASPAVRPSGRPANPYDPSKGASASAGAPFSFAAVRASAARVAPAAPAPRAPEPPPRAAPEEPPRRLPSPSPVAGPCRLPSQRTFLKREFSEIAFSETSFAKGAGCFLFRNVLYGGGCRTRPHRSALRHARRHLGPSLPHLSRGHFPLRPLGLSSLEVGEVSCLPDSPCALSASASAFVRAASSASSCSSI